MEKLKKQMNETTVRVIKISKQALFEFLYEKFVEDQEIYLDVNPVEVADAFDINWERGEFIFCAYKSEDTDGNIIAFPIEIDLQQLMKNMKDTTSTMFADNRYSEYTKEELIALSAKPE